MKKELIKAIVESYGWCETPSKNDYMYSFIVEHDGHPASRLNVYHATMSVSVQSYNRRAPKYYKDVDLVKLEMIARGDL